MNTDGHLLSADCPLFSRALVNPWRLLSLVVGLLLLIAGSILLPYEDWDIPICFVMGLPAYVLAPWAFRKVYYFRWKWWPVVGLVFWFTVDATYSAYWWWRGFPALEEFRPANFFYCTPIFWVAGFVWNVNVKTWRLPVSLPLDEHGETVARRTQWGMKMVFVVFAILLITYTVGFLSGLQRFFVGTPEPGNWVPTRILVEQNNSRK